MSTDLGELIVRVRAAVAEARTSREINREVRATAAALSGDFIGDGEAGSSRLGERARRQNVMREVNERIARLRWAQSDGEQIGYVCECSLPDCTETIELSWQTYEAVRSVSVRFVLLPGHERHDVERIVEQGSGVLIVDNIGEAAELAQVADPRSTHREGPGASRASKTRGGRG